MIGTILTVTLPLNMGIGILIGFIVAIQAHGQPVNTQQLQTTAFITEVVTVSMALLIVIVIAVASSNKSKDSEEQKHPE